jgi:hypothetical protein
MRVPESTITAGAARHAVSPSDSKRRLSKPSREDGGPVHADRATFDKSVNRQELYNSARL